MHPRAAAGGGQRHARGLGAAHPSRGPGANERQFFEVDARRRARISRRISHHPPKRWADALDSGRGRNRTRHRTASRCAWSARTSTSPSASAPRRRCAGSTKTLEQQVEERTRERDRLWRVSDDLIGVANFEGYWVSINPAATAILGWSEAELLAHADRVAVASGRRRERRSRIARSWCRAGRPCASRTAIATRTARIAGSPGPRPPRTD